MRRCTRTSRQIFEVFKLNVFHVPYFVDHAHHWRRQLFGAVRLLDSDGDVALHAAELFQEVDMEIGAAIFTVGNRLKSDALLKLHDGGNGGILRVAQL